MPGELCCRVVIARSDCAEVARCDCGHIHVSVGPVTLRVEEPVLRSLLGVLHDAVDTLEERRTSTHDIRMHSSGLKQ